MTIRRDAGSIPFIDLFAGPGGLCEGFSHEIEGRRPFKAVLSIEKDTTAYKTLELRAFVHYFTRNGLELPDEYYAYVSGETTRDELFRAHEKAAKEAKSVAWCAELGGQDVSNSEFDSRIAEAINGVKDWLLVGGPPCQAYSLVGRSRSVGGIKNKNDISREEAEVEFCKDSRQRLYQQYLRVIAVHSPAVFVMENVAGMLSAKVDNEPIFAKILNDLRSPCEIAKSYFPELAKRGKRKKHTYRIFSFVTGKEENAENGDRFLIRAEEYGVPQCRHRVILLGIRDDFLPNVNEVGRLAPSTVKRTVRDAIGGLPKKRSSISKIGSRKKLSVAEWREYVFGIRKDSVFSQIDADVRKAICNAETKRGAFSAGGKKDVDLANWFRDGRLNKPLNHEARSHMASDLWRYLFVSAYGAVHGHSPVLAEFPDGLLPAHSNVRHGGNEAEQAFADRFKVQLWGKPSSTITSHIAKDGHYFIHPDPAQCRALTVREAARLQTFPDNYFFAGNRTEQYHQVGNAVPPYLAHQLAKIVCALFDRNRQER